MGDRGRPGNLTRNSPGLAGGASAACAVVCTGVACFVPRNNRAFTLRRGKGADGGSAGREPDEA